MSQDNQNQETQTTEAQDENQLIALRREKLNEMRASGNAFPNEFKKRAVCC